MPARRILIVEDEPQLLLLLERHLKRLGFEVDPHSTGSAALRALENTSVPYDLAVADMGLPDMKGEALLAKIVALRPALPILICSGSEFFVSSLPEDLQRRTRFLQKPFLPKELAQKIEEALGG
ncbi:MAG TPA: response regulator [Bryobacteraceae bacterium]|nr:response regulator [Bryobacteraceae bacterium]